MASPLWTSAEIAQATGGIASADFSINDLSIDTRTTQTGNLFIALAGVRDGHDFVADAIAKGACGALVSRPIDTPHILVPDTQKALEDLAIAARLRAPQAKRAAVTGSVGKTSITQAIATALKQSGQPIHYPVKSFNNHIGVPLTLARMPRDTRFAVFEVGMNHADEIRPLSKLIQPHVAIINRIGPVHIENFPDGELGIAKAKAELLEGLAPNSVAVLNADGQWFDLLSQTAKEHGARVATFGITDICDAQLTNFSLKTENGIRYAEVSCLFYGRPLTFSLAQTGAHWGENALATLLAIDALGAPLDAAIAGLSTYAPLAGRGAEQTLSLNNGGSYLLIDESYNANPISMRAAFDTLNKRNVLGRKIAVLTDMLELGIESPAAHIGLANALIDAKIDLVFAAGPMMKLLYDALPHPLRGAYAENAASLAPIVKDAIEHTDAVMVKGSNGSKASTIVSYLIAQ